MCVIEQAYNLILAMCFVAFSWTGAKSLSTKAHKKRCHLDQTGLANERFFTRPRERFSCGTKAGNVRLRYAHLALSGSKSEHRDSLDLAHSRIQPYYIKQYQIYLEGTSNGTLTLNPVIIALCRL